MDLMIQSTFTILDKYDSGFWETMKELATASGRIQLGFFFLLMRFCMTMRFKV
jgi:hypothetical protein